MMHDIDGEDDYYYAHDHLYSVVSLFDDTGAVAEHYEYDAYGSVQILNSAFSILNSSQYAKPYTFAGRRLDAMDSGNLKLMYYRARTYDPQTGRFMQRDPEEYIDSMNLCEYVTSRPIVIFDPFGNKFLEWGPWVTLLDESSTKKIAEDIPLLPPVPYLKYKAFSGSICCEDPYGSYVLENHILTAFFDVELIGNLNVKGRAYTNLFGTTWQVKVHATVAIHLPIEQNDIIVSTGVPKCVHKNVVETVNKLAEIEIDSL